MKYPEEFEWDVEFGNEIILKLQKCKLISECVAVVFNPSSSALPTSKA